MRTLTLSILSMVLAGTLLLGQPPGPPPGGGGPGAGGGDGIWRRNAYWGEIQTFDACMGHQPGSGDYHYHANPICLRAQLDDNVVLVNSARTGPSYREKSAPWNHSPILGWAIDGYPIYGPYGYSDARNASSAVKRLKSGFRLRTMTARTYLPDWSMPNHAGISQQLTSSQYGPPINNLFPLGRYNEDFEYAPGFGDLDQYNGRLEVTPEFPQGTYAYHVTIDDSGNPAFPYIFGGQLYGTASGGRAQAVPDNVQAYFGTSGTTSPSLTSWLTKNGSQNAQVVTGYDPSAGPRSTWPQGVPAGVRTSGGVSTPTNADVQRIRYSDTTVYINANGLASYTMGPWFDPTMTGGVFLNYPGNQNYQFQLPRAPSEAASKPATGMGAQGMWVNGTTVFNFLDGGSYQNSTGTDGAGGNVFPTAVTVSAASSEQGPVVPGSLVTGYSLFGAELATATQAATTANWPASLGGTSIQVKDSAGISRAALLSYASASQVNFQIPSDSAAGMATVTYAVGATAIVSNVYITAAYPNLFSTPTGQAAGAVVRVRNGQQLVESITLPIAMNAAEAVYLVFYGSGLGNATDVKATVGGASAEVYYAGPQKTYPGLDQFNIRVPASLTKRGKVELVVTAAGRASNTVSVTLE